MMNEDELQPGDLINIQFGFICSWPRYSSMMMGDKPTLTHSFDTASPGKLAVYTRSFIADQISPDGLVRKQIEHRVLIIDNMLCCCQAGIISGRRVNYNGLVQRCDI